MGPEDKVGKGLVLPTTALLILLQATISPVNTDVPRIIDRSTPRAQTRQELDEEYKRKNRRTSSLEGLLASLTIFVEGT